MATTVTTDDRPDARRPGRTSAHAAPPAAAAATGSAGRPAGSGCVIVMVPIYWIVITSFKTQANYYATNPLEPPSSPTLDNYQLVIDNDFVQYFVNSVIVTAGDDHPGRGHLLHGGLRHRPRQQPVPARRSTGCS